MADNQPTTATATATHTETDKLVKMQAVVISLIDSQRNWFSTKDADGNLLPPDAFKEEYCTLGVKQNTTYKDKSGKLYTSQELITKALDAHKDQKKFMYLNGVNPKRSSSGNRVRIISFSAEQGLIGVFDGARKVSFSASQITAESFGNGSGTSNSNNNNGAVQEQMDTSKLFG